MQRLVAALLLAPLTVLTPAQDLRVDDSVGMWSAAYDEHRSHIVALGHSGETREFDGAVWRTSPQPLIPDIRFAQLVYDPFRRETIACLNRPGASNLELHRFDGRTWSPVAVSSGPPRLEGFACVFDVARAQLVLFGGQDLLGESNNTWTFDGTSWTLHAPPTTMLPRSFASLGCDSARARVVLFGGERFGTALSETWEWNGVAWQLTSNPGPSARVGAAFTFDPTRSRLVLVGGTTSSSIPFSPRLTDAWEYDGSQWLQIPGLGAASGRAFASLVHDGGLATVALFGGSTVDEEPASEVLVRGPTGWTAASTPPRPGRAYYTHAARTPAGDALLWLGNGESWTWNGHLWAQSAGTAPPDRANGAMAGGLGSVHLFGGMALPLGAPSPLAEHWVYDGVSWTQRPVPANGPTARTQAAMAVDEARNRVVLFGGATATGPFSWVALADTWTYDGIAWTLQNPATAPSPRSGHAMAYHPGRGEVILAGGLAAGGVRETWAWNGTTWNLVSASPAQPGTETTLAYDEETQQLVAAENSNQLVLWALSGQTWAPLPSVNTSTFAPGVISAPRGRGLWISDWFGVKSRSLVAARVEYYGTGCGAAPRLAANGWPRLGDAAFRIEVQRGPANAVVAVIGATQPASLPVLGCTLLVAPGEYTGALVTTPTGFASSGLAVPQQPSLLGFDLFFQAATLDATAPAGLALSDGMRLRLGS